jgi:hypothetical protein
VGDSGGFAAASFARCDLRCTVIGGSALRRRRISAASSGRAKGPPAGRADLPGQAEDGHGRSGARPESRGGSPMAALAPIGHAQLPQTRRKQPGFNRGTRRCRAAASAASFGRKPCGAAAAAHGTPGDRPPAVPAVSPLPRPPASRPDRQPRATCAGAIKVSQRPGRNAAHCPGWPLQRRGHPPLIAGDLPAQRA